MRSFVIFSIIICYCVYGQRIRYISTERPFVAYYNRKYLSFANLTSQRYGRGNPFYFVGLHFSVLISIDNNIQVDFYFYEYLSNQYKRSFVQMHFGFCELVEKNEFFGAPMRRELNDTSCPFPPGDYHLYNMSIPFEQIPKAFPFKKGRIIANITLFTGPKLKTIDLLANGHIDMEVKEYNKKTKNTM